MNEVDKLCERVNDKFGLRNRQIGSVERYTDMCTNSVVQIGNNSGGYSVLISGTDKQLISYLNAILQDKFNFYDLLIRLRWE